MDLVLGRIFFFIAMTLIIWPRRNAPYSINRWRIMALSGEGLFFFTPWRVFATVIFIVGMVLEAIRIVGHNKLTSHEPLLVRLVEVISWLWMALVLMA